MQIIKPYTKLIENVTHIIAMKGLSMSSLIYSEHLCAPISALWDIMHYVLEGPSSHSYLIFESVTFDELFYSCAETDKKKERHNPFLYDILLE